MLKNNIENLNYDSYSPQLIEYVLNLKNMDEINILLKKSKEIQNKHEQIHYGTNLYYPTIYQIEDNCPTCGYRTHEARRKYSEKYVEKIIEQKISDLKDYPIDEINCINKDITGINELLIILNKINTLDIKVNVQLSNYRNITFLKNTKIDNLIVGKDFNYYNKHENKIEEDQETIKIIKEKTKFNATYNFLISYNESYVDVMNMFDTIKKYNIEEVQIKGFDPFLDSPEEYHPQYSKDYLKKIIALLRIAFPTINIKIQYPTNKDFDIKEMTAIGINTINGIYTPKMNKKLDNTKTVLKNINLK